MKKLTIAALFMAFTSTAFANDLRLDGATIRHIEMRKHDDMRTVPISPAEARQTPATPDDVTAMSRKTRANIPGTTAQPPLPRQDSRANLANHDRVR